MSDAETPSAAAKPLFTDKEEKVLKVAWSCLKSGPPEVDIEKLQKAAGFNTQKTASNTWATIKKKLATFSSDGDSISTPKKTPTSTKKRGKKVSAANVDVEASDDDEATPATKKVKTTLAATENGRPKRGKKLTAKAQEAAEQMKMEESEGELIVVKPKSKGKAVKAEEPEEAVEEEPEEEVEEDVRPVREHGEGSEDGEILDCE
ncbi:hypothetical protein B0A48_09467 [Cryoendolithus antarcticus]|uniref:Myb-like domain-containing protein n=1 Tax=Cryoendolithus antarcticus TaxID=1507870 RepID=A0A1V8SZE8_9PEZI|nr:hypothetical protein B0A48_09467 [Cryoendolithus antarcticus]